MTDGSARTWLLLAASTWPPTPGRRVQGPLAAVVDQFTAGIRSGLSYCGAHTIPDARENAAFVRVAAIAREREGAHLDHDWESVDVDNVGVGGEQSESD